MPIGRKISGAALLSPRVIYERVALACTEGAIKALADAAELSRAGDAVGAEHLREAAETLFGEARGALDRLHSDEL